MITKLNVVILGCILLFVTPIMASSDVDIDSFGVSSAPKTAKIIVSRAIVYADESMNIPLGYISNNKLIVVGKIRKNNPGLVPLVVSGKLAFIEIKNIEMVNETISKKSSKHGPPREHNVDMLMAKLEENLFDNNSVFFSLHKFSTGGQTKDLSAVIDGEELDVFTGLEASFNHRVSGSRLLWGLGFEHDSFSTPSIKFSINFLKMVLGYTPIKNPFFLFDLIFALDFSPVASLDIKETATENKSTFVWGPNFSARVLYLPREKYHFFGTLGYRYYKVLNVDALTDVNDEPVNGITGMSGLSFGLGMAFEI